MACMTLQGPANGWRTQSYLGRWEFTYYTYLQLPIPWRPAASLMPAAVPCCITYRPATCTTGTSCLTGGAVCLQLCLLDHTENFAYMHWDEILDICAEYDISPVHWRWAEAGVHCR